MIPLHMPYSVQCGLLKIIVITAAVESMHTDVNITKRLQNHLPDVCVCVSVRESVSVCVSERECVCVCVSE